MLSRPWNKTTLPEIPNFSFFTSDLNFRRLMPLYITEILPGSAKKRLTSWPFVILLTVTTCVAFWIPSLSIARIHSNGDKLAVRSYSVLWMVAMRGRAILLEASMPALMVIQSWQWIRSYLAALFFSWTSLATRKL